MNAVTQTLATDSANAAAGSAATPSRSARRDWTPLNYDLRDAWFPVSHSRDVTEKPIRRIVHSQPYFLWRDHAGKPFAAEFRPSRGDSWRICVTPFGKGLDSQGNYPEMSAREGCSTPFVWS